MPRGASAAATHGALSPQFLAEATLDFGPMADVRAPRYVCVASSSKGTAMRKLLIATAVALAFAAPALAQQQKPSVGGESAVVTSPGKGSAARVVTITASVEAVDQAERTVTLKGPRGNVVELPVSEKVKNLDKIKVGDMVAVRYFEALSLELKKNGGGIRERSVREGKETAKPGEQPAAGAARQVTVIADVVGVDPKRQTVTLRGPKRTVDLKVKDPNQLKLVKVGDQVEATYTEAVAVSVEPAAKMKK
jgi:Cu/Ag efflux protein CusF